MTSNRILTPLQKMLLDGADYIEKWGHWKGAYFRSPYEQDWAGSLFPPACLMGSLQAVRSIAMGKRVHEGDNDPYVNQGERYMNHYLKVNDCTQWNDQPERSPAEVIQALRDAATAYKEDEWKDTWSDSIVEEVEEDEHV